MFFLNINRNKSRLCSESRIHLFMAEVSYLFLFVLRINFLKILFNGLIIEDGKLLIKNLQLFENMRKLQVVFARFEHSWNCQII